jgi:hypothetical protein
VSNANPECMFPPWDQLHTGAMPYVAVRIGEPDNLVSTEMGAHTRRGRRTHMTVVSVQDLGEPERRAGENFSSSRR